MKKLMILSDNDLSTRDISKMTDYFDSYISELRNSLQIESVEVPVQISPMDIGIISEIVNLGTGLGISGDVMYILDFDSLPKEISEGYKSGIYKLGESRQVEGNLRATLVDSSGTRVKDITIKEVQPNAQNVQTISNLMTQLQMKQITEQLNDLCDMSKYMIKRHRDRDIVEPFFRARTHIVEAQLSTDEEGQKRFLYEAIKELDNVIQSGYQYMNTDAIFLENNTRSPFWKYRDKVVRTYIGYICEDIYMINKSLGLLMQVYNHLESTDVAKTRLMEYIEAMYEFSQKPISGTKRTAIGVLQDNYPYQKKNKDMWIVFCNNINKTYEEIGKLQGLTHTYLLRAEVDHE